MQLMTSDNARDMHLMDARLIPWQSIAMAQLPVVIALLSALSISMLCAGSVLALHRDLPNPGVHGLALGLSMLLLTAVVFLCLLAAVSRTLDFRLTARKVRGKPSLALLGLNKEQLGNASWFCFWSALLLFPGGSLLFCRFLQPSACTKAAGLRMTSPQGPALLRERNKAHGQSPKQTPGPAHDA